MSMGAGVKMQEWWPSQLDVSILRQFSAEQNPLGGSFDYAQAFQSIDYNGLKADLTNLMTASQDWWPADFKSYGGLMIRLAWHSAGTYRVLDGRGGGGMGQQRFAPLNSWPDNGNLDKARRLLWPVKQKYGNKISWADLYLLAGNVALESMGFKTLGFAGGRPDTWEGDQSIYWGGEKAWFPDPKDKEVRYNGSDDIYARSEKLEKPLGASNMGLIYVDPRGPNASGDPKASARDIKMTFGRMGMTVKETAALIAGGHAFGKTHGAAPDSACGPPPEGASIEQMGLGWKSNHGNGKGEDAITSGLEVTWSKTPTKWSNDFLKALFNNEWTLVKSPGGAPQFEALNGGLDYPHAYDTNKKQRARMLVSDVALREDEEFAAICRRWLENFDELSNDFAHAWFKLLHRDMGPVSRYLGPEVPKEAFIWQDPLPTVDYAGIDESDVESLKKDILASGLSVSELVVTAWASASTFRNTDNRGGANGARIALEPQKSWEVNNPKQLAGVLKKLGEVRSKFNGGGMKEVSLADLIVLGGVAAVEKAAKDAGHSVKIPFTPGRVDATQENTDVEAFNYLHPEGDAFRNYRNPNGSFPHIKTERVLIDKAQTLSLSVPETTVLVGGMRALRANFDGGDAGVLTSAPGKLTPEFFANLLDMKYSWNADDDKAETFTGVEFGTGKKVWKATRADLIFGHHPELRAVSEVYAEAGNEGRFVNDFARAWDKVMNLDRFDVRIQKK